MRIYCESRKDIAHYVTGYQMNRDGIYQKAEYANVIWPFGAGGVCGSLRDLIKWNTSLHKGRVLEGTQYNKLITPKPLKSGFPIRYSGGLAIHEVFGRKTIEHGGAINGFFSMVYYYPDEDLTVGVIQNSQQSRPSELASEISDLVLGAPDPIEDNVLDEIACLSGVYQGLVRGGALSVEISTEDGLSIIYGNDFIIRPQYVGNLTWKKDDTTWKLLYKDNVSSELHIDVLWRGPNLYGHYVLKRPEEYHM